jgi:hypothetical protein
VIARLRKLEAALREIAATVAAGHVQEIADYALADPELTDRQRLEEIIADLSILHLEMCEVRPDAPKFQDLICAAAEWTEGEIEIIDRKAGS